MKGFIIGILIVIIVIGCNTSKNPKYMQEATGRPGDIVILIDSNQWKGALGDTLRYYLQEEVEGLPREETMFNLISVQPSKKISLLTMAKNLMYVFTLDQHTPSARSLIKGFSDETIEQIRTDTSFFIHMRDDVNARGQKVMYLFGRTQEELMNHIGQHGDQIVEYFNNAEVERIKERLFGRGRNKIADFLHDEQQCEMNLPSGYKLADKRSDFIWFRRIEREVDKDIFITWKPYESEYQFLRDSLVAWRDDVAKRYLFEDPDNPTTYLLTEMEVPFIPVTSRQVDFNGHFAMKLQGLWRTNTKSMGGPFIGYALVDEPRGLIYYIEGFAYSPGKSQREIMRELKATLNTFKTSGDINGNESSSLPTEVSTEQAE